MAAKGTRLHQAWTHVTVQLNYHSEELFSLILCNARCQSLFTIIKYPLRRHVVQVPAFIVLTVSTKKLHMGDFKNSLSFNRIRFVDLFGLKLFLSALVLN